MSFASAVYGAIGIIGLAIGVIHLIPAFYSISTPWRWWAVAVSCLGAVYSFSVAVQLTTPPGLVNLYADRISIAALIVTLTAAMGFAVTFFGTPLTRTAIITAPIQAVLVILTLFTDLVVLPDFEVCQALPFLRGTYHEATMGVLQPFAIAFLVVLSFWCTGVYVRHRRDEKMDVPVAITLLVWIVIIAFDAAKAIIRPTAPSLLVFGHLGFSVAFIFVAIRQTRSLHREAMDSRSRADAILTSSPHPVIAIDGTNRIAFMNEVFEQEFGAAAEGDRLFFESWLLKSDRTRIRKAVERCRANLTPQILEITVNRGIERSRHLSCSIAPWIRISDPQPGVVMNLTDVTDLVVQAEDRKYLASHDSLTGLMNRMALDERLSEMVAETMRKADFGQWAVLYMDLDLFKPVNDAHGHHVGDQVLVEVAERIRNNSPRRDMCFRLGGDEFIVILPGLTGEIDALLTAERIRDAVKEEILAGEIAITIGISIGITVHPRDGMTVEDVLRNADSAMYEAKDSEDAIRFFASDSDTEAQKTLKLEAHLHRAVAEDEFSVLYQPVVDRAGVVREIEALVRWHHDLDDEMPGPGVFLALAERTMDLAAIEERIFTAVASDIPSILGAFPDAGLSLNVSGPERARALAPIIQAEAERISFEIVESALDRSPEAAVRDIAFLRNAGFGITLDGFGTTDSRLGTLMSYGFDKVKVGVGRLPDGDRFGTRTRDGVGRIQDALCRMVVRLGYRCILQGIETASDIEGIDIDGCWLQGFHYWLPMDLETLLRIER